LLNTFGGDLALRRGEDASGKNQQIGCFSGQRLPYRVSKKLPTKATLSNPLA
jgi:hypothetical protein